MNVKPGTKVTNTMPDGLAWPAVCMSEMTSTPGQTRDGVAVVITRADFVSLRETKDGEPYLAFTNETVSFGYKPVALPRFDAVVGLDATEDGEKLSLQALMDLHKVSYSAFQKENYETRRGAAVSAADL
jgi:hypothetical protein